MYVHIYIPYIHAYIHTIAAKKFTKKTLYEQTVLAQFILANYKTITLQSKFLGLLSGKKKSDTPVAATLQRKSFGGIIFVIITKNDYNRKCSKDFFCNHFVS